MVDGTIIKNELEKSIEEPQIEEPQIEEPQIEEPQINTDELKKPLAGDMINYTKEIDYGVIDEDGTRISCKSMAEVRILSLLLEMKGGK